ncbi:DUF177 domain-containing protein [Chelativorans sp. SCAU2101]|uniref:DUF177 domain-containing protein n=1 Tax=Chelativorans petroleitrophicus TaxID=2975484 RepID=A0A9X2XB23_9HYPH|nr:DUF177 domain-containing protein [Chelativorans petroleitrophicus]MCT8990797.1 DUF177 domain-containing protein [Chelativorans petroleitrophicus]
MARDPVTSPVSYELNVSRLPAKGITITMEADTAQRVALARTHGLLSVEFFSTELLVRPWRGDGVRVTGRVTADMTQACVVTLEPLAARVDEEISAVFIPEGSKLARIEGESGEIVIEPEGADLPETFSGDTIDLGALAEEFFALGIDPYPRKEGAAFDITAEPPEEAAAGPLQEALMRLRNGR